jgi:IS5 family transposase
MNCKINWAIKTLRSKEDIRKSPICDYTKSKISSHAKIEDFEHFGTSIPKDVTNFTMDRAVRGRPLTKDQKERNRKISSVRAPGERPFSVIKTVFNRDRTRYKRLGRVNIQSLMSCFTFNLYQLFTLKKKGVVA